MKTFAESVGILYDDMLEKRAAMADWGKRSLIGAGIGGVGLGTLGAATADPGHRGAGFLTGGTIGAGLGGLLPYAHEMTPMANAVRKAEEMATQHGQNIDIEKIKMMAQMKKQQLADAAAFKLQKLKDAAGIKLQGMKDVAGTKGDQLKHKLRMDEFEPQAQAGAKAKAEWDQRP